MSNADPPPRVCVVTVAWNCRDQVLHLLASLHGQAAGPLPVVVVDNASADGTAEAITRQFPTVRILRQTENLGGAGGFAAGLEQAWALGAIYAWLLDGDACATPGALAALIQEIEAHPEAAIVGSQICVLGAPEQIQELGAQVDRHTAALHPLHAHESADPRLPSATVDYVPACSLLVRRAAVQACGTIRTDLFVFYDDVEWCSRMRAGGWSVRTAPRSIVLHPPHARKPLQPWRAYYLARNRIVCLEQWRHGGAGVRGLFRLLLDVELRRRRLLRADEAGLALALGSALADATRRRLGRRDGLPGRDMRPPNGWTEVAPPCIATAPRLAIIASDHAGEALSLLDGLLELRPQGALLALVPAEAMAALQQGERLVIAALPAGSRARRTAIRQHLDAFSPALVVQGDLTPLAGCTARRILWRGGRAWEPGNGTTWPMAALLAGTSDRIMALLTASMHLLRILRPGRP